MMHSVVHNKACPAVLLLVVAVLVFSGVSCPAGEIYSWSDSRGIRHYSNVAPSGQAKHFDRVQEDRSRYEGLSRTDRDKIPFTVHKIYDGDSLKVSGAGLTLMVRLVGIDAPETGGGKQTPQPFSARAKKALTRMLNDQPFTMKSYGTGGYNRVLAELFTAGKNVNLELVRLGLAEVYPGRKPAGLDTAPYKAAEQSARERRRGIWSLGSRYESPRDWRRKHPRK